MTEKDMKESMVGVQHLICGCYQGIDCPRYIAVISALHQTFEKELTKIRDNMQEVANYQLKDALIDELELALAKEGLNMYHNGGFINKLEWLEHRIDKLKKERDNE